MILAHPDSDLQKNIMVLTADVIRILSTKNRKGSFVLVEDVMDDFLKVSEKRSPDLFLNTLTFLYSLGIIERNQYRIKLLNTIKQTKQGELF
ncbi:MAG: hypothetical protein HYZ44_10220 [Bacteroidetes bacterium]|nr:hypothetical protein [Bacteroidota bacterium]